MNTLKKNQSTQKQSSSRSPSPNKPINRRDKEKLRQQYRLQLQQARVQRQKQQARLELKKLHDYGIVEAYESFLRNICKNGLPEASNVYELAAQHILKFGKKVQQKKTLKEQIVEYNSEALKKKLQK